MDAYLDIAYRVLQAARQPMTAKGILGAAYKARIVPPHLYGKTQEKTLQARLSEDILYRHNRSLFFRTEPGYFFLVEFMYDEAIPDKYKEPFTARRRIRDLCRGPVLSIKRDFFEETNIHLRQNWSQLIWFAEKNKAINYIDPDNDSDENLTVWTFSVVRRNEYILAYRVGRYREFRDSFENKKTIGFPGVVSLSDNTLFSDGDYGVGENSLSALMYDLDISLSVIQDRGVSGPIPKLALKVNRNDNINILLLVMEWWCPAWFEPTTRRLSINNPCWISVSVPPNDPLDYEPWSIDLLSQRGSIFDANNIKRESDFSPL